MSAWTAITEGVDWQAVSFINEYISAHNERARVCEESTMPLATGGEDIQDRYWGDAIIWTLQTFIEDNLWRFVRAYEGGVKLTADHYDGKAEPPDYYNYDDMADLMNRVYGTSITGLSFRRATAWPDNWQSLTDPAYSYGKAQQGDIIGPWLFYDLQRAFNGLIWTDARPDVLEAECWYGRAVDEPSPSAAQAAAEADWQNVGWDSYIHKNPPMAQTYWHNGSDYDAEMWRQSVKLKITDNYPLKVGLPTHCKRAIDWFYYVTAYWGNWQSHGDDVIEDRYSLFATDEPAADVAHPESPEFPDASDRSGMVWNPTQDRWGWQDDDYDGPPAALVRWDVASGVINCV